MDGLNRATLLGNLGDDPELAFTPNNKAVLKLRVATTTSYFDQAQEKRVERTEWHSCVVWGDRAVGLSKILCRGSRLYIEGEIRTREYEAKDGSKRRVTEIVASELVLCGGKRRDNERDNNTADEAQAPNREPRTKKKTK